MQYVIAIVIMLVASVAQTQTVSTRQQLLNAVNAATPGSTITIVDGVYTNWGEIIIPRTSDGTANQRITLRAQTKCGAIFRGQNALRLVARSAFWDIRDIQWENQTGFDPYERAATGVGGLINIDGAQDLIVEGNCMRNLNGEGVVMPIIEKFGNRQTRRITIRNNIVDGITQTGRSSFIYMYGGADGGFVRDIEITGNSFLNRTCNTTQRFCYWLKYGDGQNSALYDSGLVIVGNNFQFDNLSASGQDIFHFKGRKMTIKGNFFHFVGGITFRQGNEHIVANNISANANTSRHPAQFRFYGSNHQFINNLFYTTIASRRAIILGKGTTDTNGDGKIEYFAFKDSVIAHNTLVDFRDEAITMNQNTNDSNDGISTIFPSGLIFHNNFISQSTGTMFLGTNCASRFASISHNGRNGTAAAGCMSIGTNNINANPQWETGGYAPAEGSPLIDAGVAVPGYPETRLDMFGRIRDSSPDIGPIERVSATPPPPPPPGTCDGIFGTASGYILCEETSTTCSFNANLGGGSCNDVCGSFGKACVGAIDNPDASCTEISPNFDTCSTVRQDEICICEIDEPPPPPTIVRRYVDASCPTPGNGTTEICGTNGPWNSIKYALETVECVGMQPGDVVEIKGMTTTPLDGNWYSDTYYNELSIKPGVGCTGVIVRPAIGEDVVLDGTVDIKSSPWVHIGSNVYECRDAATCGTSANFPFTAWVSISGTESRLDLIQSVRTCQTSLASGKMTYNPNTRFVCVHLPGGVNPSSADYLRIPSHNVAIQLYTKPVHDMVFQSHPSGDGEFTITRYRDRHFDMSPSVNSNITIDRLNFSWALRRGISSDSTAFGLSPAIGNHKIVGNKISYIGEYGIYMFGDLGNFLVEENTIDHIGFSPVFEQCFEAGVGCLPAYSNNSVAILINNCAPEDGQPRGLIRLNEISDIGGGRAGLSDGIRMESCTYNNTVNANLFYDSTAIPGGFTAIRLTGIPAGQYHNANLFSNNRCEDVDRCFRTDYEAITNQTGKRNWLYGNTCYNNNMSCWSQGAGGSSGGELLVQNNLAVKDDGYSLLLNVGTETFWTNLRNNGFECDHASCAGQPIARFSGIDYFSDNECNEATNCISNINPGAGNIYGSFNVQPETLAIVTGSDAIDSGATLALLPTDHRGVSRPFGLGYDIGAYEITDLDVPVSLAQDGFQVYNRFSVDGAIPLTGFNEIPTLYKNSQYTLRIRLYGQPDSIQDTADLTLYVQYCNPTCGEYEGVTLACDGNAVCLVDNPLTTDGTAISNKMPLDGRSFSLNSNYIDGEEEGDGHAYLVGPNQQLELEFSLGMGSITEDIQIYLRATARATVDTASGPQLIESDLSNQETLDYITQDNPFHEVRFQVRHVNGAELHRYGVIPVIRIGPMKSKMQFNR